MGTITGGHDLAESSGTDNVDLLANGNVFQLPYDTPILDPAGDGTALVLAWGANNTIQGGYLAFFPVTDGSGATVSYQILGVDVDNRSSSDTSDDILTMAQGWTGPVDLHSDQASVASIEDIETLLDQRVQCIPLRFLILRLVMDQKCSTSP